MKLLKTFSNLQSGFNTDGYSYDMPWRKNYEWHCAVFEGIFAFLAGFFILFPVRFFYEGILWYALCFCLFLCLLDSWKGWLMWRRLNNLRGRPLYFMKFSELVSKMEEPGFENDQYLGKGFIWEKRHAQAAYDILRTDYQTAIKDEYSKQKMGMSWIHGIELNESDMWQPLKHVEGHTLITGLPGSGKTRLFDMLISQCIRRGESVLIIDPKGDADMRENARQACKECGCEEQFVFFHPAFPAQSVAIDPLKNFNRTTELASRIKALLPTGGSSESFTSFAWNAVNNVCQGMVYCSIKPSLTKIRAYIEGGVEDLTIQAVKMHARKIDEQVARHQKLKVDKYFGSSYSATLENDLQKAAEFLDNPKVATKYSKKQLLASAAASFYHVNFEERYPEQAIAGLINVLEHNHDHYSKMIANLLPILQMLTSDTLKELLSPDEQNSSIPIFDNKAFLEEQMVVCIGLDSLSDSTVGKSVGSLLLADLASVAGERFNFTDPKLMKPINIFVDEACEVLNEPFIQLLNKGRGAAMRLFVATQNISDFSAVMGSEARANQILGNINNKFALRTNDKKTMDYLSEHMPMTTVKYVQRGQSFGASADTPLKHQGHLDERLMEKDQALFPPQLFSLIPNLEYIAFISGGTTIKGRIPIIIRDEANVGENPIKIVPSIDEDYIKGVLVSDKVAGLNSTDWDEYVRGSPEQPGQHEGQMNIDGQLQAKQDNLADVEIWGAPVQFQENETDPQEQSKLEAEA